MNSTKLLIAGLGGCVDQGEKFFSYEWNHFYLGLKNSFYQVNFFDISEEIQHGQQAMQNKLLDAIKDGQPDILLFIPHVNEFSSDFVVMLQQYTKVCGFFHDDSWRQNFVKVWGPCFNIFTTSDCRGVAKYQELGLNNAVYLPFGVNESLFTKAKDSNKNIDVSFVGSWHPYRQWLLNKLKNSGVVVEVYGSGWNTKLLDGPEMIDVMQRSKICLNLSNSVNYDLRYLVSSPRAMINTFRSPKNKEQVKGRHFEIPACETMQLSYYVEGLSSLFEFGKEIEVFNSPEEFVEKIQYYLMRPDEIKKIAEAGYKRVRAEHSYAQRFLTLFTNLGWVK